MTRIPIVILVLALFYVPIEMQFLLMSGFLYIVHMLPLSTKACITVVPSFLSLHFIAHPLIYTVDFLQDDTGWSEKEAYFMYEYNDFLETNGYVLPCPE